MRIWDKNKTKNEKRKSRPTKPMLIQGNNAKKEGNENEENKEKIVTTDMDTEVVTEAIENTEKAQLVEKVVEPLYDNQVTPVFPKYTYKRLVTKKLTVLLLETTSKVAMQKENLMKIAKSLVAPGILIIINYGSYVTVSETIDIPNYFNSDINFFYNETTGSETCLYDALVQLQTIVNAMYMKTTENENEKIMVKNIDIIGIGTCEDNNSKVSKEKGIESFSTVVSKPDIVTKYFCLTEESFINAAEVGFHSIGAISRNYQ